MCHCPCAAYQAGAFYKQKQKHLNFTKMVREHSRQYKGVKEQIVMNI